MDTSIMSSHCSRQSDDEEEDLELLRLAALKSLHNKKEPCNSVASYNSPPQSRNAPLPPIANYAIQQIPTSAKIYSTNNTIRPIDNIAPKPHGYYPPPTHNLPISGPINNHIDSFSARQRLEEVDLNEPYVPQRVPPVGAIGGVPPVGSVNNWHQEPSVAGSSYNILPYVAQKPNDNIELSNVQLSPRSLAFVAENNDILMRRITENLLQRSPSYSPPSPQYNPIPSPAYRPNTPESWTNSPLPKHKSPSRSPGRTNNNHQLRYGSRRSFSRSPIPLRPRSPVFRRRSMSRSPAPQHVSRHSSPSIHHRYSSRSPPPQSSIVRRPKSRSPPVHIRHKASPQLRRHGSRSPQHLNRHVRPMSRSPQPALNGGKRRSPLVTVRHINKTRRSTSPHSRRSPPNHENKELNGRHPVRMRNSPPAQMLNQLTRRSCSPRRRSHSRSPPRKYARRSRERGVVGNNNNNMQMRRRSPHNTTRRRHDGHINGFRNRIQKRSRTPIHDRRKRSRTKSPATVNVDKNRNRDGGRGIKRTDRDNRKLDDTNRNDRYPFDNRTPPTNTSEKLVSKKENPIESISENQFKEKDIHVQMEQREEAELLEDNSSPRLSVIEEEGKLKHQPQLEKETLMDKTDEPIANDTPFNTAIEEVEEDNVDDTSEDDDDGIDLFPSDESESENEGRFKSSTSKNERDTQASTLSFSKLGSSLSPVIVKDLKDVGTNAIMMRSAANKTERDNRGRRNYDRRRGGAGMDDRFRKTDNRRNHIRNDRQNKNGSRSSSTSSRRDRDELTKLEEKKKDDKPMFKSTFQAVESEANRQINLKATTEKDNSDRRNMVHLKRPTNNKEMKEFLDKENATEQMQSAILTASTSSSSSASSSSNSGLSNKKPIHLRLGAMTNTFKAPKKSSAWNGPEKQASPSSSIVQDVSAVYPTCAPGYNNLSNTVLSMDEVITNKP